MKYTGYACDICGKITDYDTVCAIENFLFPIFEIPVQYFCVNERELKIDFSVYKKGERSDLMLCSDCQKKLIRFLSSISFKFEHVILRGYGASKGEGTEKIFAPVIPCPKCGQTPAFYCRSYPGNQKRIEIFCNDNCVSNGDGEGWEEAIANWNARRLNWIANEVFMGRL